MPSAPAHLSLVAVAALAAACAIPPVTPPPVAVNGSFLGYTSSKYADPAAWLCRADLPTDPCHADLGATEIRADGSRAPAPHAPAAAAKVDCFYVYPTVDLGLMPDNHTDFSDRGPMTRTTLAQAARFGEVCNLYVPLYRQITIGTYLGGEEQRERRLEVAFSDVSDAFAHYLGQYNHGRKMAIIGHSQGAEMVVRLLRKYFDHDPAMREKLLVAMAVGGQVEAPKGQLKGGTFESIPACTAPDEQGCVVAFRSYRAGAEVSPDRWAPKPGNETVCVNPASVDRNERSSLSRSYFPADERSMKALRGIAGVTTPYVLYRDFFTVECASGPSGYRYLAVSLAPGARQSPIDLESRWLNTSLGLHILDLQLPQGDLIELVRRRAATLP